MNALLNSEFDNSNETFRNGNGGGWDSLKEVNFYGEADRLDRDSQRELLRSIDGPIQLYGVATVNKNLGDDKHFRRILGYAVAGNNGFNNYTLVMNEGAVSAFENFFPTPIDFENVRDELLMKIQLANSDAKYREYVQDMDRFQSTIYGEKYERYKGLQNSDIKDRETSSEIAKAEGVLEKCTDIEKNLMLKNAIIDGDDFVYQGKKYTLTPGALKEIGLSPEYKTTLGDMGIGLSGCFSVNGRDTIIGYVESDEGYKVRGYYRSNSQGVWRYLPDYVSDENGSIVWYGKGYAEEMLTLPCEMQVALSKAAEKTWVPVEQKTLPSFILAGTAKSWPDKATYAQAVQARALKGDLYREVATTPEVNFGKLSTIKQAPETISVTGPAQPNYNKELMTWDSEAKIYGRLKNRVFESYDKKLKYVISEDTSGRCFVSSIETNSKPTSCGVRSEWVSGGDVETPLYEYPRQANNYGDTGDIRGRYEGMWKNYVSRMKIIQDYLATKK